MLTHVNNTCIIRSTIRPLGYERVYLPLYKVADIPFHIQRDVLYSVHFLFSYFLFRYMQNANWAWTIIGLYSVCLI